MNWVEEGVVAEEATEKEELIRIFKPLKRECGLVFTKVPWSCWTFNKLEAWQGIASSKDGLPADEATLAFHVFPDN